MTHEPEPDGSTGHIVLCGLDELGLRTLEELRRLGEDVVVIARAPDEEFAYHARSLGARIIDGSYRDESVLHRANVPDAAALVITEDDDVGNLHAALAAQDLNPQLRIGLRMFNVELGRRVRPMFRNCTILDPSAIAAPAFVSAALSEPWEQTIEVAGRRLVVRQSARDNPDVLLVLARVNDDGSAELFPSGQDEVLCLTTAPTATPRSEDSGEDGKRRFHTPRRVQALWEVLATADRRLQYLGLLIFGMASLSTLVFSAFAGLSLVDALYFTTAIITTIGFGDINLRDAPAPLKLYGIVFMLLGAAVLAVLYAFITDILVGARLARQSGMLPRHIRDHVVVCGLGTIGYRVVEQLSRMCVPVVAAELQEAGAFVPAARALGVPILFANARLTETLEALRLNDARCLIISTDDDVANLETALNARALNPDLRIVLRLFHPDFAARVERTFDIHMSRSPSALAAPAFAAAAEGERVLGTVPLGLQALIFFVARVEAGSDAVGRTIARLEQETETRVVVRTSNGRQTWLPSGTDTLTVDQDLMIVATREGLARVLASTETTRHHYGERDA